ncbi:MAG: NADH-quinone oxidoreductase subunit C [Dehalococcoidia bacterium]
MSQLPRPTSHEIKPRAQAPSEELAAALGAAGEGLDIEVGETKTDVDVRVSAENLPALVQRLTEDPALAFDYLRNVVGIDMGEDGLAAKYHLYSFEHGHSVQITVLTPPGSPQIPSLTSFFAAANWHEREAAEMVGLAFEGHPDLRNLLLEEDLKIHPLLKTHPLQEAEILQGIEEGPPGFSF